MWQAKCERQLKEKTSFTHSDWVLSQVILILHLDSQHPVTFSKGEITINTVSAEDYKACHSKQPSKGDVMMVVGECLCKSMEFNTAVRMK